MELIEMNTQIIEMDKIEIKCSHTVFCNRTRYDFPKISELEKQVKEIRKELKSKKVSLGKTDTLKLLKESKEEYSEAVQLYNQTFDNLLVAWSNKMHLGMYTGYSDDEYYNEVILPLEFSLQRMNNVTNILDKIKYIQSRANEIQDQIKHGVEFVKVYI